MRVALAVAIVVWTLAAWGGRIGLLTSDESVWSWVRIGGSLLVGLLAAATLVLAPLQDVRRPVLIVFAVFTVVLWVRGLVVNWIGDGSLSFKLVHTVLGLGFFALAWWAWTLATSAEA
jgi:hypothetical protein